MKEKVNVTLVCGGEVLLKSIKKGKKINGVSADAAYQ